MSAGPGRKYDIFPGIFVTPINSRKGIQYLFGDNAGSKSHVLIFGQYISLPHERIHVDHVYRIVFEVDANRQLTITRDEKEIYRCRLPEGADLRGPIQCGGGLGDVTYRRLSIGVKPKAGPKEVGVNARVPGAIEPRFMPAELELTNAGVGARWCEGLEPEQLRTRYWKIVNVGLPADFALNVYNEENGRGRCRAFAGKWAAYTGQLWDLREPGLFTNRFLTPNRVLSFDASGEVFMGSRQPQQEGFWTIRNPGGRSFKIRAPGGYLSAAEKTDARDVPVFLSPQDLGDRSDWAFLPTEQLIVDAERIRP